MLRWTQCLRRESHSYAIAATCDVYRIRTPAHTYLHFLVRLVPALQVDTHTVAHLFVGVGWGCLA